MTETPVRRQFVVLGRITVSVVAESDAEARELLAVNTGDTIDLGGFPVREGEVTITGLDLLPLGAQPGRAGEGQVEGSLSDADYGISDIARVAAEELEGDWESSGSEWEESATLTSGDADFGYFLEVVEGRLGLFHQDASCACAWFRSGDSLRVIVDGVVAAVLCDIEHG
ncbi:hypothetical protein [Streptomyces anulatus]|uniref:hypothetical protein n=1 Tax=Streptomyces anulatus TaxID=1892 RepID=UPI002E0DA356|nr:hypothetical protein OG274_38305 [Streptomyces anulatus]